MSNHKDYRKEKKRSEAYSAYFNNLCEFNAWLRRKGDQLLAAGGVGQEAGRMYLYNMMKEHQRDCDEPAEKWSFSKEAIGDYTYSADNAGANTSRRRRGQMSGGEEEEAYTGRGKKSKQATVVVPVVPPPSTHDPTAHLQEKEQLEKGLLATLAHTERMSKDQEVQRRAMNRKMEEELEQLAQQQEKVKARHDLKYRTFDEYWIALGAPKSREGKRSSSVSREGGGGDSPQSSRGSTAPGRRGNRRSRAVSRRNEINNSDTITLDNASMTDSLDGTFAAGVDSLEVRCCVLLCAFILF